MAAAAAGELAGETDAAGAGATGAGATAAGAAGDASAFGFVVPARAGVKAGGSGSTSFLAGSGARNGSGVLGSLLVTPVDFRGRICGVIITTSSV